MPANPSLTALRAFDCLARCSSFTKAAAMLNVTRPAISKQVRELEKSLGCDLVHRSGPNVALTDQGRELAAGLRQGFDLIASTTQRIAQPSDRRNNLRLLVERDFASSWLAHQIGGFLLANPGVSVEVTTAGNRDLREDETFSFRIFYGPEGRFAEKGLTECLLCDWIDLPVCTAEYAAAHIGEGGQHKKARILVDRNYDIWVEWFGKSNLPPPGSDTKYTSFNDTTLCLSAALTGAGLTMGDSFLCLLMLRDGRLVAPFKMGMRSAEQYMICHSVGHVLTPAERAFKAWLQESVQRYEADVAAVLHEKEILVV